MEENNEMKVETKKSNAMYIIMAILVVALLGCVIYIAYPKLFNKDNDNLGDNTENKVDNDNNEEILDFKNYKLDLEKYDKVVKSMDGNYFAQYYPNNISNDESNLYNILVTKNNTYGLYFNKSINIDNISSDEMIELALINYINENNLKIGSASCFMDTDESIFTGKPYAGEKNCNVKPILKTTLDNYIKEKYNTQREFSSDGKVKMISISESPIGYIYDSSSKSYYVGYFPQSGGVEQVSRWLIYISKDENNIYFYDKAMYCDASGSWGYMGCQVSEDSEKKLFEIVEDEYSNDLKELVGESGLDGVSYDLDYDYIFNNYELPVYKHTFKKANDGKYYWYSTEIVK